MTTLILSDTHLTSRFNKRKFNFLEKIIKTADFVIINGDFWNSFTSTFDEFVNSKWNKLFPLLKARNTIYIYGNHDREKECDHRIYEFCDNALDIYRFEIKDNVYIVTHGDTHNFYEKILETLPIKVMQFFYYFFDLLAFANMYLGNVFYIKSAFDVKNSLARKYPNNFIIAAHSHVPEIDIKNKYINSGFIQNGFASYVLFNNSKPELIKTIY